MIMVRPGAEATPGLILTWARTGVMQWYAGAIGKGPLRTEAARFHLHQRKQVTVRLVGLRIQVVGSVALVDWWARQSAVAEMAVRQMAIVSWSNAARSWCWAGTSVASS
jgi:hypothetical protein